MRNLSKQDRFRKYIYNFIKGVDVLGLNEAQEKAALHFMHPCMVIAGPGSGKTTTLITRIYNLVEIYGVKPENILVLTYTKAAAKEMEHRYFNRKRFTDIPDKGGQITFGTFHAVCYQILKSHFHLQKDSLISEKEKKIYINPLLKSKNISFESAEEVLRCISLSKNGFMWENICLPEGVSGENFEDIKSMYAEKMKQNGKIDFDDMVNQCFHLFQTNPDVLKNWQVRFPFLLVDEFQDCNALQYKLLGLLAGTAANLFVVGDDDQSIYGFRGAKPGIMKQFLKDYKNAECIFLNANYRSVKEIVSASNKVISQNKNRIVKNIYAVRNECAEQQISPVSVRHFKEKKEQYQYLAGRIKMLAVKQNLSGMAVICRTNREIQDLLPFLKEKNVRYQIKGVEQNLYGHFTVKDIAAFLQLASGNTERYHMLQIMNKPNRGIERSWITSSYFLWKDMIREAKASGDYKAADAISIFEKQCVKAGEMSPYLAINWIRKVMGYDRWLCLQAGTDSMLFTEWQGILDEIQKAAKGFATIAEWLWYADSKENAIDAELKTKNTDTIQLMTMHGAKGLEFDHVFIPNVNEGNLPHGKSREDAAVEEERRLFYVAMTRAKKALEVFYLTGTKEHPRQPCIFLKELWEYSEDYSSDTSSSNS